MSAHPSIPDVDAVTVWVEPLPLSSNQRVDGGNYRFGFSALAPGQKTMPMEPADRMIREHDSEQCAGDGPGFVAIAVVQQLPTNHCAYRALGAVKQRSLAQAA